MHILLALFAGLFLGLIFFGGLWLTVKKGLSSASPALWFLLSFVLRSLIVLAGFFFLSKWGLLSVLTGVAGFITSRLLIKKFLPVDAPVLKSESKINDET